MITGLKRHGARVQAFMMLTCAALACITLADAFHWIEIGRTASLVVGWMTVLFGVLNGLTYLWLRRPDNN